MRGDGKNQYPRNKSVVFRSDQLEQLFPDRTVHWSYIWAALQHNAWVLGPEIELTGVVPGY